jgi:hypothetical protein
MHTLPTNLSERINRIPDQFWDLRLEAEKAVKIGVEDPDAALVRARKVMDHIARDLYEHRFQGTAGTRPQAELIDSLVKAEVFPRHLKAHAAFIREMGNTATHYVGETTTTQHVQYALGRYTS